MLGSMKSTLFTFILLLSFQGKASCVPSGSSCDFYACAGEALGCDSENFLAKVGYKYCEKYRTTEGQFSPQGQRWLQAIRLCLQEELAVNQLSCENSATLGWQSHLTCYDALHFCSLPRQDKNHVISIAKKMLLDPASWSLAIHLSKCL